MSLPKHVRKKLMSCRDACCCLSSFCQHFKKNFNCTHKKKETNQATMSSEKTTSKKLTHEKKHDNMLEKLMALFVKFAKDPKKEAAVQMNQIDVNESLGNGKSKILDS